MNDLELDRTVRSAVSGSSEAWDELVGRFAGLVWGIARSYRLDTADAADVSQTVWLRLAEHIAKLRDPERIGAWLAITARNEAQRVQRIRRRHLTVSHDQLTQLPETNPRPPEASLVADENALALWRAFEQIPSNCQTLLRMLISDPPASYAVVSEVLGMPIGSIGPRRSRCLSSLRELVAKTELGETEPVEDLVVPR